VLRNICGFIATPKATETTMHIAPLLAVTLLLPLCQSLLAANTRDVASTVRISEFGAHPSWSPDSLSVVFSICGCVRAQGGIWVYNRSSQQIRQIQDKGFSPAWSPKTNQIAFHRNARLMITGPTDEVAIDTGLAAGPNIQWSPDGRFLLSGDGSRNATKSVLVTDTTTWTQRRFEFAAIEPRAVSPELTWTSDGHLLLTAPFGGLTPWPEQELREFSLAGRRLRQFSLAQFNRRPFGIRVSPDNKRLAFGQGSRGIWLAGSDGSNARQILEVGAAPAWSPDNRWIVFDDSSSTPDVHNGIFLLEIQPGP
jgi:hypothetical protein